MFKVLEKKYSKIATLEASLQVTRESLEGIISEKEMKMTSDLLKMKLQNQDLNALSPIIRLNLAMV